MKLLKEGYSMVVVVVIIIAIMVVLLDNLTESLLWTERLIAMKVTLLNVVPLFQ